MDLVRFRYEMCPRKDQKTILEDYIKEIISSPLDAKSQKYCEILVNNLYAHGNTYNNQLQMQKLVMLKMKGILEDFSPLNQYFRSPSSADVQRDQVNQLALENFL
jgi:hypothetical protein